MSDKIKYQTWETYLLSRISESSDVESPSVNEFALYFNALDELDVNDFLMFQIEQYERAISSGYELEQPENWKKIFEIASICLSHFENNEYEALAIKMCRLGRVIEKMQQPSPEQLSDLRKAKVKVLETHENNNLIKKQKFRDTAYRCALGLAAHHWLNDSDKSIRTGGMCKIVREELNRADRDADNDLVAYFARHSFTLSEFLPESDVDLKKWFKDIAPEYAKKGGRRKN